MGVEPTIFTLQKWCIANYATAPFKYLIPIYSISQIKKSTLSYLDQIRPGQTYRGVSCPSRCWSQSPTRTLFYVRHLGGFMGIFNPQIISRTQPLVIVSDLAKFKPLPLSGIKTVQTMGIEPITADNLGSILSQRSHQIAASI